MVKTYDVPPIDEVMQGDIPEERHVVPVAVENVVRTDEMPTITLYRNVIVRGGDPAQKILQDNPRRKKSVITVYVMGNGCEMMCVGEKESKATQFSGYMLFCNTTMAVRYEFTDKGPLWARGAIANDTTGTFTGFDVANDDAILSVAEELWAE